MSTEVRILQGAEEERESAPSAPLPPIGVPQNVYLRPGQGQEEDADVTEKLIGANLGNSPLVLHSEEKKKAADEFEDIPEYVGTVG